LINTAFDGTDVPPDSFVTVKVYDILAASPATVVLTPVPVLVVAPGYCVSVHCPVSGRPLSTTLPVGTAQVGWVIVPTRGGVCPRSVIVVTINMDAMVRSLLIYRSAISKIPVLFSIKEALLKGYVNCTVYIDINPVPFVDSLSGRIIKPFNMLHKQPDLCL
jgi:hypothetical protein